MNLTFNRTNRDKREANTFARMSNATMRNAILPYLSAWWNIPHEIIRPVDVVVNNLTGRWSYDIGKHYPDNKYVQNGKLYGFCASYPKSNMPSAGHTCKVLAWWRKVDSDTIEAYRDVLDCNYPEPHTILRDEDTGYPVGFEHLNAFLAEEHKKHKMAELVKHKKAKGEKA